MSVAALPSFGADGLDQAQLSLNRLQQLINLLDSSLRLPNNPRAFMIYLLGLSIVFAGAFVHVLIAAQITQAEFALTKLQEEYRSIEEQNGHIIFQIARDTNLMSLHARVVEQGYVPVQEREYVFVPADTLLDSSALANAEQNKAAQPTVSQPATAAQATALMNSINSDAQTNIGQFARWEEFFAVGTNPNAALTSASNTGVSNTGASIDTPAFWSTWWEQTTARGSELIKEFSAQ
jgi:hypothetical protein